MIDSESISSTASVQGPCQECMFITNKWQNSSTSVHTWRIART
jgi:hypothetical protein